MSFLVSENQATNSLHELLRIVKKLDPSPTDLLFVKSLLCSLCALLSLEDDEGLSGLPSVLLLDEGVLVRDLGVVSEELGDFLLLDLEWETSQEEASGRVILLAVVIDVDGGAMVVAISNTIIRG